ncbi:MAG TPA: flagellar biosynthetic protein FliQ [Verrucomicrobiales bacterium]|jgi:flagellar biosynthetic protein FliQ|nr:flagellar biosynthetic protein FliQ [Verrucomicrobiales bacterium]|tara:strand:+ start:1011 stop:1280 length:270 start_codon:yes stop_codon:yes gene_type:complete
MSPDYVVELMKGLMAHIMMIALPLLVTGMTVGLLVSLFQAVTSLQEQTLTFVPKALAVSTLLFFIMPWIVRTLMDYTKNIFDKIPSMTT